MASDCDDAEISGPDGSGDGGGADLRYNAIDDARIFVANDRFAWPGKGEC
jgi:hypothetical protein